MAIFVDLDKSPAPASHHRYHLSKSEDLLDARLSTAPFVVPHPTPPFEPSEEPVEPPSLETLLVALPTPNLSAPAAVRALACYPVAISIARHVDLNTLDSLALTCWNIHDALVGFRAALMKGALRCQKESRICARDRVGECRRCAEVVCRNCIVKPPNTSAAYRGRHRRLCATCTRAPLTSLFIPPLAEKLANPEIVKHALCTCETSDVWLCQDCGRGMASGDSLYQRLWTWRQTYGEVSGGLGTGIADSNRGVICGRASHCLAAKEYPQELDCVAEDRRTPSPMGYDRSTTERRGPGYNRQMMEGVGGMRMKLVRMVRVGASVGWEGEGKGKGRRSWCGWCWRPVAGERDREILEGR